MKKTLTLAVILLLSHPLFAQTLKSDGTIIDKDYRIIGYYRNGEIQDKDHHAIGYIKDDGTITKGWTNVIGYIKNGTIYNTSHFEVATITSNGYVQDQSWQTKATISSYNVGKSDMYVEAVLKYFFFK